MFTARLTVGCAATSTQSASATSDLFRFKQLAGRMDLLIDKLLKLSQVNPRAMSVRSSTWAASATASPGPCTNWTCRPSHERSASVGQIKGSSQ